MSRRKRDKSRSRSRTSKTVDPSPEQRVLGAKAELCKTPEAAHALFLDWKSADGQYAIDGFEYLLAHMAAWTAFVDRGVTAALQLQRAGLGDQAAPIRRNNLEHAITCYTVAREPGAFDAVLRAHQHSAQKMLDATTKAGVEYAEVDDLLQVLAWEFDESTKGLSHLAQAKAKFEGFEGAGDRLYINWLEETTMSHPTPATAGQFLQPTADDDFPTLMIDPQFQLEDWFVASCCTEALLLCLQSLSSITQADPLAAAIDAQHSHRLALYDQLEESS